MIRFVVKSGKVIGQGRKRHKEVVNEQLGLRPYEFHGLIRELTSEGYLRASLAHSLGNEYWMIYHLTDAGLREIGELPDPHTELLQQLMERLDLAIEQIHQDQRLSEPQKQQSINWLEEGKIVARTLTIDAIKAIIAGAIL